MLSTFLYKFQAGSAFYRYNKSAFLISLNGEDYQPAQVTHTLPTWSDEPQDAEIDVTIIESVELAEVLITPPPYPIILDIYEYDYEEESAFHYYRGWVVRCPFKLDQSIIIPHLKTLWHYYEKEALSDSLGPLSRYNIYDPRSGADVSSLKETVTITVFNSERDILTVTGITQLDDYYKGGYIEAPNLDKRTILKDVTESGDRKLYLNGGFPRFTLDVGFTADVYPGDDLRYVTWANKFSAFTNNGEAWGGWEFTPTVDPAKRGVS